MNPPPPPASLAFANASRGLLPSVEISYTRVGTGGPCYRAPKCFEASRIEDWRSWSLRVTMDGCAYGFHIGENATKYDQSTSDFPLTTAPTLPSTDPPCSPRLSDTGESRWRTAANCSATSSSQQRKRLKNISVTGGKRGRVQKLGMTSKNG